MASCTIHRPGALPARSALLGVALALGVAACSSAETGGGGGAGGGEPQPLEECRTSGPLENAACGGALANLCAASTTEGDCSAVAAQTFGDARLEFYCAWADEVVLDDASSCAVGAASSRCVAVVEDSSTEEGCSTRCTGSIPEQDFVLLDTGALLALPCGRAGGPLGGPIDETMAGSADERSWTDCGGASAPPACGCAAQACEALP